MSEMKRVKSALAQLMKLRRGEAFGISAASLSRTLATTERTLRNLITELREEGMPICGRPETGYFLADTAAELQETCAFLRARALKSLLLESRLRQLSLPELLGQMRIELESQGE